ncbi:SocA family protein [bacterium]|nr:SocA family protein [bacterium]
MYSVFDIANWFLSKESMTHKKLQKLCYYAQAWHYTLLDEPLFSERIEAWVHGPVIPALYKKYSDYGWIDIPKYSGKLKDFNNKTLDILQTVLNTYLEFDGDMLERITHAENPWKEARKGLPPLATCTNEITLESMKAFYRQLYDEEQGE